MKPTTTASRFVLTFVMLLTTLLVAQAANYTVNTTADSGPGSLRDTITQANANPGADTINFDSALTASGPAIISLTNALPDITAALTITGPGQSKLTVKNGVADPNNPEGNPAGLFRIFTAAVNVPDAVSIAGLTMTNGVGAKAVGAEIPDVSGGGIVNTGTGTLNVTDCAITNNYAKFVGGGIGNLIGIVNVTRCIVTGNTTQNYGGGLGMYAPPGSEAGILRIDASVISGNRAQARSGGLFANGGTITMTSSIVDGNSAPLFGGISMSSGGTLSIDRSTIRNNQATNGLAGGISVIDTTTIVSNSTISGNTVTGTSVVTPAGAGIFVEFGTTTLTNCTVANNQWLGGPNGTLGAGGLSLISNDSRVMVNINNCTISGNSSIGGPGGLLNRLFTTTTPSGNATVNIRGSILAGNTSTPPANPSELSSLAGIISDGYNVVGDNEMTSVPPVAADQVGVTVAQLNIAALADNGGPTDTMALLPGSVAIDNGLANGLTTDQRGYGRVFDTATPNAVDGTDVGAYEAQSLTFVVTTTADSGSGSLRDAITQSNLNPDADRITFAIPTSDPGYDPASGRWTINLQSALPEIADSVTMIGPGQNKLTVRNGLFVFGVTDPFTNGAPIFRVFTVAVSEPQVVSISHLTVSNGVVSNGPNGQTATARTGGGILNGGTGTLNLTDCAITKNYGRVGVGAAIVNYVTGTLNVTRCNVSENGDPTFGGGGLLNIGQGSSSHTGIMRVSDSTISSNAGRDAGGIVNGGFNAELFVSNCRIVGNRGEGTGGISGVGRLSILDSTIADNTGTGFGHGEGAGGIAIGHGFSGTRAEISNCTISGNSGSISGGVGGVGGLWVHNAAVNVTNCTFAANRGLLSGYAPVCAGAISVWNVHGLELGNIVNVRNCTLTANSANGGPGGILIQAGVPSDNLTVNLKSSIMAFNSSAVSPGPPQFAYLPANSAGYNVIGDPDTIAPFIPIAGDQVGVTAAQLNLGPLANNGGPIETMVLGLGSIAINRGFADTSLLPNDQRGAGFARVVGVSADVGAFEVQNTAPVARAKNVTVPAGSNCQASVTPQQVDNGSSDPDGGDTITLTLTPSGPFAIGTHYVTLTARDSLGYSSTATAVVTVTDNTAPVITAPAPTTATANNQGKAPVPNVLAQTTTSDCSMVTLQQSPAAGTLVGIGVQTITITATDSANNKKTATTTFTVKAGPPSFTISVNPSTVKQGGMVTFTTAYSNYASTPQTVTLKISLTGPSGKTLMLTVPLTLPANRSGSVSLPLLIPKSTKVGVYSLTLDVFQGTTQVGTSSAQLTVTK